MSMSTYLEQQTADYTSEELTIPAHNVLTEDGVINQKILTSYSDTVAVIEYPGEQTFIVTLQWDILTDTDTEIIKSLFYNPTKANKYAKTFYWQHPSEIEVADKLYTVRFISPLQAAHKAGLPGYQTIQQIKLRVEGTKT